MHTMVTQTRRTSVKQIAILITDGGFDNIGDTAIAAATAAKNDNITIIVIGYKHYK